MSDSNTVEQSDYGMGAKTLPVYLTGIILCVILTLIPFAAVMHGSFTKGATLAIVGISALIQFFVQVICFLRLNTKTEQGRMNVMSLMLAILILAVIVGGSLWIMFSLNYYMMH